MERLLTTKTAAARIGITEDELLGRIITLRGPRATATAPDPLNNLYRAEDIDAYVAHQPK